MNASLADEVRPRLTKHCKNITHSKKQSTGPTYVDCVYTGVPRNKNQKSNHLLRKPCCCLLKLYIPAPLFLATTIFSHGATDQFKSVRTSDPPLQYTRDKFDPSWVSLPVAPFGPGNLVLIQDLCMHAVTLSTDDSLSSQLKLPIHAAPTTVKK